MLLVVASPPHLRIAVAVYSVSTVLLFTSSAMLHVGSWGPRTHGVLRRIDHCGIFFLIAGSFTPFAAALLPPGTAATMLWLVWVGAVAGALFRVFWLKAPRWVYTPVYLALGMDRGLLHAGHRRRRRVGDSGAADCGRCDVIRPEP